MLPPKDPGPKTNPVMIVFAIAMVMVGCCSNVVFMELIVKKDSAAGNLVTFAQFFVIALEGFFANLSGWGFKKRKIPLRWYFYNVAIYWLSSVIVNKAFAFQIAMPLHVIFRSGSLLAVLVLSMLVLKKKYSVKEIAAVGMVTVGIVAATLASRKLSADSSKAGSDDMMWWSVGIAMLAAASFLSAALGIVQETMFGRYGKQVSESMFYNHLLSLPCFGFFFADILSHVRIFNDSAPITIPYLPFSVPSLWLWMVGNVATQFLCSKGVYTLMSYTNAVTVNIVVTCRKFISLLVSIFYFGNPFLPLHWVGTVLVFGGTYVYTMESIARSKKEKM